MPGSSDTTRPTSTSAFAAPDATWSRTYSTVSHSRTSPATITSTVGSIASAAWIGVDPGSNPMVRNRIDGSPTTRMPPSASRRRPTVPTSASRVVAGTV